MLFTCPVLEFTPFVTEMFEWFRLTYTVESGFGFAQWRRSALPYDGGLAGQPAKLIAALDFIAQQRNSAIAATLKKSREPDQKPRRDG